MWKVAYVKQIKTKALQQETIALFVLWRKIPRSFQNFWHTSNTCGHCCTHSKHTSSDKNPSGHSCSCVKRKSRPKQRPGTTQSDSPGNADNLTTSESKKLGNGMTALWSWRYHTLSEVSDVDKLTHLWVRPLSSAITCDTERFTIEMLIYEHRACMWKRIEATYHSVASS